jgi:hypothetical protein
MVGVAEGSGGSVILVVSVGIEVVTSRPLQPTSKRRHINDKIAILICILSGKAKML